jgi:ferredoxin
MRAKVDQLKCRTVGECVKTCPDVFRFQGGSKKATVLLDPIPQPSIIPGCHPPYL